MKFLHTSDWHLGRSLYGRKRYREQGAFLDWLIATIEKEKVDVLLVAGDVFDTGMPGNQAQELYYRFLCQTAATCCRHVVVIGGNHDSPSFLNAPKELLRTLNVYVVGAITDSLEDEIIEIYGCEDSCPNPAQTAIICAVPYLRDKDIRVMEPGETIDDKNKKLALAIKTHYAEVVKLAEEKRSRLNQKSHFKNQQSKIPILGMGHLFTAGGQTVDGDGVRELYVGSLAHVRSDIFPASLDYLALGHLHMPQTVGGTEHIRYSGSPIPMGYSEAGQQKSVVIAEFDANGQQPKITLIPVPCFQELIRVAGDWDTINARLNALKKEKSTAWLEIEYTGASIMDNLRERIEETVSGSGMEIRRIKNQWVMERVISQTAQQESLDDLSVSDVFQRCLEVFNVPPEDRKELMATHDEIIQEIREEDCNNF